MSKLRDQHKAFAEWFLQQNPIAPNVEDMAWAAWKAALAQPENRPCTCHPDDNPPQSCAQRYALTECKALALSETKAEPVAWLNRYHAAMVTQDRATANAMGFTTPLYTHPPRDEWREAVHEHLITCHIFSKENSVDPRQALSDLIAWHCKIALDPAVSIEAQELFDRGRRSVAPTLE